MSSQMTINQNIMEMEYAVRGPIPLRAAELKAAAGQHPLQYREPTGPRPATHHILSSGPEPDRGPGLIARERQLEDRCSRAGRDHPRRCLGAR